jgi:hypothetical protein
MSITVIERTETGERIANGVAWLDEHHPGWADQIDLDTFRMESCTQCVAGQLDIWYSEIVTGYQKGLDRARRLGMYAGSGSPEDQQTYRELEAEWRRVIEERQDG